MYGTSSQTTCCTLPHSAPRLAGSLSTLKACSAAFLVGVSHQPGAPSPSCGGESIGSGGWGGVGEVDVAELRIGAALHQRGPVDHVQVDLEAGALELLGHQQRHVVVEVVLAA